MRVGQVKCNTIILAPTSDASLTIIDRWIVSLNTTQCTRVHQCKKKAQFVCEEEENNNQIEKS